MNPKILLTGSTGYVGTKFAEMYGTKFDIFGVSRADETHPLDLLDFDALKAAFNTFSPDFVVHTAADLGRDSTNSTEITETNPRITQALIDLALTNNTPFIFTSTEAVYGGKESEGGYVETDSYKPRSPYGASKVASEKLVMASGLPYLITRGHRHVGISKRFHRPKQFLDALNQLTDGQEVHLDAQKLFTPVLINNVCDIIAHYIANDPTKQIVMNVGIDKPVTFYDFMVDVAKALSLNPELAKPDGNETGWPTNSTLSMARLHELGYPSVGYEEVLEKIKADAL